MSLDIRSQRFAEHQHRFDTLRGIRAGHNQVWKIVLMLAAIGTVTLSSVFAVLSATVLPQICVLSGRFSLFAAAFVLFIHVSLLLANIKSGFPRTYAFFLFLVFLASWILYFPKRLDEGFNIVSFLLGFLIGEILSLVGIVAIAQCMVFTFSSCKLRISLVILLLSFSLGIGFVWVAVSTTETRGNFPFSIAVFLSIYITAVVIARKTLTQWEKFQWLKPQAVFWAAVGGTSFKGLNLSKLDFTDSILENTDLRAKNLYRTCFRGVKGLEKARVDNAYLDLGKPKVQELLVNGYSSDLDFEKVNLRGAYLNHADLRNFQLSEANLDGADLRGADLRDSVLLRTILTDADLSGANLTGACIKDWSFNQQTCFDNIVCDYVYREYEQGAPSDRYPASRNFEPGEFQTLFQKLTNAVELIFKDQVDWRALSFAFEKFQIEDDGLGLELKGVEQRGNYWVVKVTHGEGVSRQKVERQVQETYDDLRGLLEAKDQQINQLLGIMDGQTKALSQQSEALNNYSQRSFGNNFFISGSNITNLAGSGTIEYREAAECVRNLVTQPSESAFTLQRLFALLNDCNIATTADVQQDLIQQVLLAEAENDLQFKQLLLQDGAQMIKTLRNEALSAAVKYVMSQLRA